MSFFESLPAEASVRHILQLNKPVGRHFIEVGEKFLARGGWQPGKHLAHSTKE